ncbi:hypothetical protein TNCV_4770261 [Trichonephila clavipes]|nr:hypothetical protein TNCV_4770261 [Trichonephila clavipes]
MYSFVRGARLFVKGAREPEDPDNLPDPGDAGPDHHMSVYQQQSRSQMASASQESKEVFRTAHNRSGLRTVHTSRVIRKTTTLTRGDQKVPVRTSGTQHEAIRSSSVASMTSFGGRENGSQTRNITEQNFKSVHRSDIVDNDVHVKRVHKTYDTTDARKKIRTNKISDIITHQTDERITAKEALLRWAQRTTDRYPGVRVGDFTSSWRDGLAFNAIIHRNRPDLIDYKSCMKRSARDNLDSAFTIAERELNVTKLLDPEDVDTPEPDEKSLITYISSLYDVFPRPPTHNSFSVEDDKTRKVEEYKDLSSSLYLWMREALSSLQDRNFPNTLVEMKSLLADCTRFRVEDIPPRLHDKQRLNHIYREIQKIYRDFSSLDISDELRVESIERLWNKVLSAHQDRDHAIHNEIAR